MLLFTLFSRQHYEVEITNYQLGVLTIGLVISLVIASIVDRLVFNVKKNRILIFSIPFVIISFTVYFGGLSRVWNKVFVDFNSLGEFWVVLAIITIYSILFSLILVYLISFVKKYQGYLNILLSVTTLVVLSLNVIKVNWDLSLGIYGIIFWFCMLGILFSISKLVQQNSISNFLYNIKFVDLLIYFGMLTYAVYRAKRLRDSSCPPWMNCSWTNSMSLDQYNIIFKDPFIPIIIIFGILLFVYITKIYLLPFVKKLINLIHPFPFNVMLYLLILVYHLDYLLEVFQKIITNGLSGQFYVIVLITFSVFVLILLWIGSKIGYLLQYCFIIIMTIVSIFTLSIYENLILLLFPIAIYELISRKKIATNNFQTIENDNFESIVSEKSIFDSIKKSWFVIFLLIVMGLLLAGVVIKNVYDKTMNPTHGKLVYRYSEDKDSAGVYEQIGDIAMCGDDLFYLVQSESILSVNSFDIQKRKLNWNVDLENEKRDSFLISSCRDAEGFIILFSTKTVDNIDIFDEIVVKKIDLNNGDERYSRSFKPSFFAIEKKIHQYVIFDRVEERIYFVNTDDFTQDQNKNSTDVIELVPSRDHIAVMETMLSCDVGLRKLYLVGEYRTQITTLDHGKSGFMALCESGDLYNFFPSIYSGQSISILSETQLFSNNKLVTVDYDNSKIRINSLTDVKDEKTIAFEEDIIYCFDYQENLKCLIRDNSRKYFARK